MESSPSTETTTMNIVRFLMMKSSSSSSPNRISKFLSRKVIHELIAIGAIKIDGRTLTTEDASTDPSRYNVEVVMMSPPQNQNQNDDHIIQSVISKVEIQPEAIENLKKNIRVWAYMKPEGIDCNLNEKERSSLIHILRRVPSSIIPGNCSPKPIGRLDKDSCGLLLLTNSGALSERLTNPSFDHEKEYNVHIARKKFDDKDADEAELKQTFYTKMSDGSAKWRNTKTGKEETVLPCKVTRRLLTSSSEANSSNNNQNESFSIVLKQGLNRQIRNMVESVAGSKSEGFYVTFLKRVRVGPFKSSENYESDFSKVQQSRDQAPDIREIVGEELDQLIDWAFFEEEEKEVNPDLPLRREREE